MSDRLQAAIALIQSGRSWQGGQILAQLVIDNPYNESAWMWLAGIVDSDQKRRDCLNRVLIINPDNRFARQGLARLAEQASRPQRRAVESVEQSASTAAVALPQRPPAGEPNFLDRFSVTRLMGELGFEPLADQTADLLALVEKTPPTPKRRRAAPSPPRRALSMPFGAAKTLLAAIKPPGRKQFNVASPPHPSLVLSIFDYGDEAEPALDSEEAMLLDRLRRKRAGRAAETDRLSVVKVWLVAAFLALFGLLGVGATLLWLG